MRKPSLRSVLSPFAIVAVAALSLAGCANNETSSPAKSSESVEVSKDADAAAKLPSEIADKGVIAIGIDPTYPPNESKDAQGQPVGWEVELMDAMAAKLGVKTEYTVAKFDNIIPGITGGKYDMGLSSFFDTKEREKQVDMVDYYTAGIQWATLKGKTVDPDDACGITLAVQNGTTQQLEDGPAKSKACTDAGKEKITLLGFDTQDDATAAVTLGRAQAVSADSPVIQYAVKQSDGKLELSGDVYDVFLYGMPTAKGDTALDEALVAALDSLKADGTYEAILKKWGVESGALSEFKINGAER
ncbi:MAG: ABC transporter substrate-binding protein [Nocardioides sp.]|uniref:ABC transporter substrate-binding protein n=1 Tax=Nocardioides sp. TaxID=35761 RepID=UPI0039E54A01